MFLESMRPFKLKHIGGTDRRQVPADALSRLHVANLHLEQTEDELDPETIRLMAGGEGDDDCNMFGDTPTNSASTQTLPLNPFEDIRAHNATSC